MLRNHGASKLPVIRATSKTVSIRDGDAYYQNSWNLSPKARPDIYTADRTRSVKWITFYTDADSIRVRLKPGGYANFVIVLNGKDSCFTRVASAIPASAMKQPQHLTHDTIPFSLTAESAIQINARINDRDTLRLHFDSGSFDFHLTRDALSNKPAAKHIEKLQMGTMVWNHPQIYSTARTANGMDGRIGYNVFEGKIVELNYERHLLIIHSKLPGDLKGYQKLPLHFIRSFVCIAGAFNIDGRVYPGEFFMDTGSNEALILDSGWVAKLKFPQDLKLLHEAILHDPRGKAYKMRTVLVPAFSVGRQQFQNVTADLLGGPNPSNFEINYVGNDLLKRFDMIFDFYHDQLYIKPNSLFAAPYRLPNS